MFAKLKQKRSSQVFLIVFLISLFFTYWLIRHYQHTMHTTIAAVKEKAQQQTIDDAQDLNNFISSLVPLVQSLAQELSSKKISKEAIEKRLQEKPVEVSGFGVAFAPYAYDAKT